ncbi:FAD-binding protein [Cryptosporangium sp. NPDC048952]|uniref:FAD-binding protein n=1 Tax=Cryptosporangium sp. NPDC048952 TaxID=3363961 RepID=UPI0037179D8C
MSLGRAAVVVCVGGGVLGGSPRAVCRLVADVASALGGEVGATRAVVDAGWIGSSLLVGASGVTIDPVVYLGFGVSGTAFHEIGRPAHVVSVNTDPAAPLMARATLPLRTDAIALLHELAPRLRAAYRPRAGRPWAEELRAGCGHRRAGEDVNGVDLRRMDGRVYERMRMVTGGPIRPVRPIVPLLAVEAAAALIDYLEECC